MAAAALLVLGLWAGACRDPNDVAPGDGGTGDMQVALPNCTVAPDCFACCAGTYESGALDYDSSLMSCACTSSSCLGACGSSVCGSTLGVDGPCRDCLTGVLGDGGVCQGAATQCVVTDGPCGSFADCVAACPH